MLANTVHWLNTGAVMTHAEWVPVGRLHNSGLLAACAFLLTTNDFRMAACDILRQVSQRKQDKVRDYSSACLFSKARYEVWSYGHHVMSWTSHHMVLRPSGVKSIAP